MLSQTRQKQTSRVFVELLPQLQDISSIAHDEILPLVLEETLVEDDAHRPRQNIKESSKEWIDDLGQIFRLFKKHNYDIQETLSAIHRVLFWRVHNFSLLQPHGQSSILYFIPHPLLNPAFKDSVVSTPPILYFNLGELTKLANSSSTSLSSKISQLKQLLVYTYEAARLYLKDLDRTLSEIQIASGSTGDPALEVDQVRILQFVLMVDVRGASLLSNLGKEVAGWLAEELAPNYPGVCSAVYVVNYSWSHNALWALIRPFLPGRVLERISFPSQAELLDHFPPECLPEGQGGLLPSCPNGHDPLTQWHYPTGRTSCSTGEGEYHTTVAFPTPTSESPSDTLSTPTWAGSSSEIKPRPTFLHPFSPANPYFGYPVMLHPLPAHQADILPQVPVPLHSRRRYRDLLLTLLRLLALKWQKRLYTVTAATKRVTKAIRTLQDICPVSYYKSRGLYAMMVMMIGSFVLTRWKRRVVSKTKLIGV